LRKKIPPDQLANRPVDDPPARISACIHGVGPLIGSRQRRYTKGVDDLNADLAKK
jgi:hypothetical protein